MSSTYATPALPPIGSEPPAASSGDELAAAVQAELRKAPYPELARLTCELQGGVLRLRGRVPTYYLKQLAQAIVGRTVQILEVDNQIDVAPAPSRRGLRPEPLGRWRFGSRS